MSDADELAEEAMETIDVDKLLLHGLWVLICVAAGCLIWLTAAAVVSP